MVKSVTPSPRVASCTPNSFRPVSAGSLRLPGLPSARSQHWQTAGGHSEQQPHLHLMSFAPFSTFNKNKSGIFAWSCPSTAPHLVIFSSHITQLVIPWIIPVTSVTELMRLFTLLPFSANFDVPLIYGLCEPLFPPWLLYHIYHLLFSPT